jgi:hypothetical protein
LDVLTTAEPAPVTAASAVPGYSGILYPGPAPREADADPDYFADLHLDDVEGSITSGRDEYHLAPFVRARCVDEATIAYRHEVFRDLEDEGAAQAVRAFAASMAEMRGYLARLRKHHYEREGQWWVLRAGLTYRRAVEELRDALGERGVRSAGLLATGRMLRDYTATEAYSAMAGDGDAASAALAGVRYRLRMAGPKVAVSRLEPDTPDYGAEVLATFARFRQGDGREYKFEFREYPELNHVEAAIADRVALLFPEAFGALAAFAERHAGFVDPRVDQFDREAQFYLAFTELIGRAGRAGGGFCYPEVVEAGAELHAEATFDLALATRLASGGQRVVVNDIDLRPPERMLVVTCPNQGGKTTFARTVGQLLHLAALGVPVPGRRARLPLVDGIHALFEREEAVEDLVSKLEDDLRRMRAILAEISDRSAVIMNETFSSTTVADQSFINRRVLEAVGAAGAWCVTVTFLDELASLTPATVSMVSAVDPDEPARRTFRIVRRPADGRAYALAIAEKHRLTYPQVVGRATP